MNQFSEQTSLQTKGNQTSVTGTLKTTQEYRAAKSTELQVQQNNLVAEFKERKQSGTFEKWELVSSHIGRRSFASNFFGLLPTSSIMFMTGHTTEAQFYAYIGKAERTKAFQIADIWDREQKTRE